MSNHSIMLVDEHPLIRHSLKQLIKAAPEFTVVAEVSNGIDVINVANQLKPDIIMIDINISNMYGPEVIRQIRKEGIKSYILILSLSANRIDVYNAIDAGANGYLLKNCELDMLVNSLKSAANGLPVFSNQIHQYLNNRHQYQDSLSSLTKREFEVLREIANGLKNREISKSLFISEETVKVHIRNLLKKLNVRSRLEASLVYMRAK
ncbi:response regulator [Arsenophonus apicola]|uniref:response regulator n=1 Tax=Arsenophonus apicola TaxID=2879119 RepID=UPI003879EBBD